MEENTIDTTDRISMLPDSIVHHILSYLLEDVKSRVRMSVLSKEWFALTACFPFLYFRLTGAWYNMFLSENVRKYIREAFYKYVEYTVSRFYDQNMSAHTLNISADILNIEQIELFGRCLHLVLEKGLQMMDIHLSYYPQNMPIFRLPNTLLSASALTSLTLHQCELPSSLMVGIVKFQSLRLMSLSHLPIDEGVIEYLTKCCPLLEEINLRCCYGFKTICVERHQNLLKVEIYCDARLDLLEKVDVKAPNLSHFLLDSKNYPYKALSIFLSSCKKLTTFCYSGFPLKRFNAFLSNFPFLENVSLNLLSPVDNLRLSHHSLRRLELQSKCDLEEIDLNAPSLLLFVYCDRINFRYFTPFVMEGSSLSKGYMRCEKMEFFDILWFEKLRKFLDRNSIFKVLKLVIHQITIPHAKLCLPIVLMKKLIDAEKLKLSMSSPYKLEHVELEVNFLCKSPVYVAPLVDTVLWCCRPRSLTLYLCYCRDASHVVEYTYEKLVQQEDKGQTNIKLVLISFSKDEQHFRDLNSLLKVISLDQSGCCKITFIKKKLCEIS